MQPMLACSKLADLEKLGTFPEIKIKKRAGRLRTPNDNTLWCSPRFCSG